MTRDRGSLTEARSVINYDESTPLVVDLADRHEAPRDKYWLTYWIMFFFGIVSLLPWYVFPTVEQYFRLQLFSYQYIGLHIVNYMALATQVPAAIVLFINTYIVRKFPERGRILISQSIILVMFTLSMVLARLDMDDHQLLFLILTVSSVILINIASSVFQGGVFAIASRFPEAYRQAIMSGQGLGGLIAASSNLASLLAIGGPEHLNRQQLAKGAVSYFVAAMLVTALSMCGYLYMYRLEFVRYFPQRAEMRRRHRDGFFSNLWKVLKGMWHMALSTFLVFLVSLSIYPGLGAKIKSVRELPTTCNDTQPSNGTGQYRFNDSFDNNTVSDPGLEAWVCTYFQPVVCFLMFNFTSFIGRTTPARLRKPGPRYLLVPVIMRFTLIGLYAFCKYSVDHKPYFNSDIAPMVLMAVTGFTNGYFNALAFIYAPTLVDENDVETAGALMAASEGLSSLAGVSLGLLLTDLYMQDVQKMMPMIHV